MKPTIPSNRSRLNPIPDDAALYKERHLVALLSGKIQTMTV